MTFSVLIPDDDLVAMDFGTALALETMVGDLVEQGRASVLRIEHPQRTVIHGPLAMCIAIVDVMEDHRRLHPSSR